MGCTSQLAPSPGGRTTLGGLSTSPGFLYAENTDWPQGAKRLSGKTGLTLAWRRPCAPPGAGAAPTAPGTAEVGSTVGTGSSAGRRLPVTSAFKCWGHFNAGQSDPQPCLSGVTITPVRGCLISGSWKPWVGRRQGEPGPSVSWGGSRRQQPPGGTSRLQPPSAAGPAEETLGGRGSSVAGSWLLFCQCFSCENRASSPLRKRDSEPPRDAPPREATPSQRRLAGHQRLVGAPTPCQPPGSAGPRPLASALSSPVAGAAAGHRCRRLVPQPSPARPPWGFSTQSPAPAETLAACSRWRDRKSVV